MIDSRQSLQGHLEPSGAPGRWIRLGFLCLSIGASVLGPTETKVSAAQLVQRDFDQTFFAGAYFDKRISSASTLARYLVRPSAPKASGRLRGTELTKVARRVLAGNSDLTKAIGLDLHHGDQGNPLAVFVGRAQHIEELFPLPDAHGRQRATTVLVTVSIDIFSDQAAFRTTRSFESLYSITWLARTARIASKNPLSEKELIRLYREAFEVALRDAASQAARELQNRRERSVATFQINDVHLPKKSPLLDDLVRRSLQANHSSSSATASELERDRLKTEIRHVVHQAVLRELEKRGANDIALLSPKSPWTLGNIHHLLEGRLNYLDGDPIVHQVDAVSMNGYPITVALGELGPMRGDEAQADYSEFVRAIFLARIQRDDQVFPQHVRDPKKKTATGIGVSPPRRVPRGLERSTNRDDALSALRDASAELAGSLADLMEKTSKEIQK